MTGTDFAYIAVRPCGCVTAATVDRPEYAEVVAEDLADWVLSGRRVERTTVEDARARLTSCEHVEASA